MEPYERQPRLNRNRLTIPGYINHNRCRRNTFRSLYESFITGTYEEYRGAVVKGTRITLNTFLFKIVNDSVAYITVNRESNTYSVKVFFPVTQYNKFRLFLRNLGIKAWGRKERTYIKVGNREVDCKNLTELLVPDIPFTTWNIIVPPATTARPVYTGTRNPQQQGIFSQTLEEGSRAVGAARRLFGIDTNSPPAFRGTFPRPFNISIPPEIRQSDVFDLSRDRILTAERTYNPLQQIGTSTDTSVSTTTLTRDDIFQSLNYIHNLFTRNNSNV